jgi:lincosamide nucleotidyltransferase A/C/D/E
LRRKVFLAEDAIDIYKKLVANGIKVWVTGGWGIDALLGVQKELWSENRQAIDARGIETATAFVLHDAEGHELDVHAMHLDEQGNGIPDWDADEGFIFTKQDLSGEGMIAGFTVPCITPEKQVLCHKGYEMPDKQRFDLKLLNEKFGVDIPKE